MRKLLPLVFGLILHGLVAQDPQFSQYYAAPLLLNPAMAGGADCYRAGMNARSQWTGLPGGAFNTASLFIDLNHPDLRSGFGLMALHDEIGTPRLSSNEISGFYSYLAPVSKMVNFRMGLQGTFVSKNIDYSRLIFEDQFTGIVVTSQATNDQVSQYRRVNFADFSAGVILFGEDSYWLGFSAHHLTEPNQGFYYSSKLPRKYSLHGGVNISLRKESRYVNALVLTPTFMYKAQDRFDQLDIGTYLIKAPLLLGIWYRGIPVKKDENIFNKDAIDIQVGYQYQGFAFTYSYDFTISKLNIKNTMGSHEISLVYVFCLNWPKRKKPAKNIRKLPCPDFQRSLKYKGNF
jgi:type IX secretion system PorP/SprF family membrane protein